MRLQVESLLTAIKGLGCTPIPQNDVMLAVSACAPDVLSSMASTMVAGAAVQIAAAKARATWHSLGPNDSMPACSEPFVGTLLPLGLQPDSTCLLSFSNNCLVLHYPLSNGIFEHRMILASRLFVNYTT